MPDTNDIGDVLAVLKANGVEGKGPRQFPPVHLWNPERSADIGMEIRKDGSWWHEGGRINRHKLVDLFATILRRDNDGSHWLVTPHEKVVVHVEDAPFLAVRVDRAGRGDDQTLLFTTNLGDTVVCDADHPLRVVTDPETQSPAPYVTVRSGLEAKLTRPTFYELVEWGEERGDDHRLSIQSRGQRFDLGPLIPA